jgi:thioredoxin reductase
VAKDIGGQVAKKAVDIENYPGFEKISGPELVELYQKQLKANNLEVAMEEVVNVKKPGAHFVIETKSGKSFEALAVVVASGAKSKLLNIPGEEEFAGRGVSYCSLCDGPVFRDKIVAVVGGGNAGFESALFLSNYVKQVYLLEYGEKPNADAENQELVSKHENIKVITSAKALRVEGKVFVNALVYEDRNSGATASAQGSGASKEQKLEVNGVFVEIGYDPATTFLGDLVELNEKREIIFDAKTLQTKTPGLFSAGDCNVSKYKQIVMASGQGAVAALSAYEYIKKLK